MLSRQAQAFREQRSRAILSEAEVEVADSFTKAADRYRNDPVALQLRAMNMVYESMRNKGGLVLVPSDALAGMNLGTTLGLKAYHDQQAAGGQTAGANAQASGNLGSSTTDSDDGAGEGAPGGPAATDPADGEDSREQENSDG